MILVLYIATLALHAVFISYVVAGTAFALARPHDSLATIVRERLPFMLGCGITAGVAPLLFLQLMHQQRFYTANLLMGPRWLVVVPALIVGFYALYAAKSFVRLRRVALAVGLVCFMFVAWSWSEMHELMLADATWQAFYAAGERVFVAGTIAPRLVVFGGAMATLFATVAAWSADVPTRRRLALLALLGRLVSIGGAVWLWRAGFDPSGVARAWAYVLIAAAVIDAGAWAAVRRTGSDSAIAVATAAGTMALVAAAVTREAPRLALIETTHDIAGRPGGTVVFGVVALLGVAAITWVIRTVRA